MKCWECGQELETDHIQALARSRERERIVVLLLRNADAFMGSGDRDTGAAFEAFADELMGAGQHEDSV